MAENIGNLDISKTFSNVLLSNVKALGSNPNKSDTLGIPTNLDTAARRDNARVQDGLGNSSPLLVSQTAVAVDNPPQVEDSVARFAEILEAITYSQNNQLIF
jgi:hypothetical protein